MRVEDFQGEQYTLIQSPDDILEFNEYYGVDYPYFIIEWDLTSGCADKIYGAENFFLNSWVHFISNA